MKKAILALADGTVFQGTAIGADGMCVGEVVFNTAMTGYQEILTDPSYAKQIVTLTYPHIGNTGMNAQDNESTKGWVEGLIIRDLPAISSNWRKQQTLDQWLHSQNIVAISGVDTRRLTRLLRSGGAQNGCILVGEDTARAIQAAREFPGLLNMDLAKVVTTAKAYAWEEGTFRFESNKVGRPRTKSKHIVAYDYGVKYNMLRLLVDQAYRVTVVPAKTPFSEAMALKPDALLFSNGPGDPAACDYAIKTIQSALAQNLPILGICLGFQLLALACGAKTVKMKFGHHGANHPVIDINTQQVFITSQNHGFTVDENTLPADIDITHRSLFDSTIQGIKHRSKPAVAFQGHPEASPGPHEMQGIFAEFVRYLM